MKTLLHFIKTTITGGLLFLIPLVLILIVVAKAFNFLRPLLARAVSRLQIESILGVASLTILTILLLVLMCFIAGLLVRLDKMRSLNRITEDLILKFVPGFEYLKTIAGEQDVEVTDAFRAILLQDGDAWVIAFIVEEDPDGYTTVFFPRSPRFNSGTSKTLPNSSLCYHTVSMREALICLRSYGAGSAALLNRQEGIKTHQSHGPMN